jgi:heme exporter protein A
VSLLHLSEFVCWRDDEPLFEAVTFTLEPGDAVQVVGPNGAGKTTLLRSLCGLYAGYTGEVTWRDATLMPTDYTYLQQVFFLGHNPGVKKSLTVLENLHWYAAVQEGIRLGDALAVLAQVGLADYAHVSCQQLSAGQLRRVALARLYITQRPLWILDEPFTAIDVAGVAALEARIMEQSSRGGAVLFTTHQAVALQAIKNLTLQPTRGEP